MKHSPLSVLFWESQVSLADWFFLQPASGQFRTVREIRFSTQLWKSHDEAAPVRGSELISYRCNVALHTHISTLIIYFAYLVVNDAYVVASHSDRTMSKVKTPVKKPPEQESNIIPLSLWH